MRIISVVSILCLGGISCYYPVSYTYRIDLKSNTIKVTYHDLRSDEDADSSVAEDWLEVRKSLEYHDSLYETNYYKPVSRKLFQEDSVLSGTFTYRIITTDTTYSIVNMLKAITGSDEEHNVSWHGTNKEIYLFVDRDADYPLKSTNGKLIQTDSTAISVWPANDSLFILSFGVDSDSAGASLLPYYLSDKSIKKKKRLPK